jgi:hypothetical protein
MPQYRVLRDTFLSHAGRILRADEVVDIDWPKGCEPKKLGDNLELVEDKPKRTAKQTDAGGLT